LLLTVLGLAMPAYALEPGDAPFSIRSHPGAELRTRSHRARTASTGANADHHVDGPWRESRQASGLEAWRRRLHHKTDYAIARLRKKLEPEPHHPRFIHSVRSEGYRLTPDLAL